MTRDNKNIAIGVLHGGRPSGDKSCKQGLVHHAAWTDLTDKTIQSWIKENVKDVTILKRTALHRNIYLQISLFHEHTPKNSTLHVECPILLSLYEFSNKKIVILKHDITENCINILHIYFTVIIIHRNSGGIQSLQSSRTEVCHRPC